MAAARTEAVQLQPVGLDHKAVLGRNLFLQPFNLAVLEFYNRSTAGADEMVVMALMRDIVVLRLGAEVAGLGDACFAEEIQRAVNRGESEVGIFLRQLMIHRLGRDVFLSQERRQDEFALTSQLQLMLGQVLAKHVHFFESLAHGA